jgi:hypothetical protein
MSSLISHELRRRIKSDHLPAVVLRWRRGILALREEYEMPPALRTTQRESLTAGTGVDHCDDSAASFAAVRCET